MQAVGCCLFPSTDTVENIPLEARWHFNDLTKENNSDDIKCTFIHPFTDKVSFECMNMVLFRFAGTFYKGSVTSVICIVATHSGCQKVL